MVLVPARTLEELTAPGGLFPLTRTEVDGDVVEYFDREPRTLRDAFIATRDYGDLDAVVSGDLRWTFGQQWDLVVTLAHRFRSDLGVRGGDRVAIAMRNHPEWIIAFWATQLLGAVTVPVNGWLTSAELKDLLADCRPALLVADAERIERIAEAPGVLPASVSHVVSVRYSGAERTVRYEDLVAHPIAGGDPPDVVVDPHDVATILYTSGTTGRPKGAVGTHASHAAAVLNKLIRGYQRDVEIPDDADPAELARPPASNKLVTFPFFHIAGLNTLYSATYSGHKMVLMHKWDVHEALRLVEAERVNEMSGAPFVVRGLLDEVARTSRDLSSLRSLGLGGSAAPAQLILDVRDVFGGQVTARTGYGLTETTSGVVAISGDDYVRHPSSVGKPLPTVRIGILDDEGTPVAQGSEGEVVVAGPQVVRGYDDRPEETAKAFRDGWFHTGDLGRIDADGFLYIVGRIKDVVIRGGENISCGEVESALGNHPDVLEVAAFAVPHPSLGEELAVAVRLRDGAATTAQDLRDFTAARLAAFKVPAHVVFYDEPLPRGGTGKILKRQLRQP